HSALVHASAHAPRWTVAGRRARRRLGSRRRRAVARPAARARARVVVRHMIVFRQVDARYPFLWEDSSQPAGRWHAEGEGPAHYFSDVPDGAWAELLRHEEITDVDDLRTIRRQMWAVDIGDPPAERIALPRHVLTGGVDTYARCQHAARTA